MAAYQYKAKAVDGRLVSGKVEATNEQAFFTELERRGLYCITFKEVGQHNVQVSGRLSLKQLNVFCRELGVMIAAGIPVISALNTMHRRRKHKKIKTCYLILVEQLEKGSSMAEAMRSMGNVFPEILIAMVDVGEQSGSLDVVISNMADFYSKEHESRNKMQTMLIYPTILVVVTIGIVIAIFTLVLPRFFTLFAGQELPGITKVFMGISNLLVNEWMLLLLVLLFVLIAVIMIGKTDTGRYYFDKMKSNIPVVSKLMEKGVISRFANTMGILVNSGVAMLDAINICSATLGNVYTMERMARVSEEVEKGIPFSSAMEKEELFEDMVWSMMAVGEESGKSGEMYEKLYVYYEQESNIATQKLLAILEPAVMIIIGLLIGLVMVSVLLPLYGIYA